MESINIPNFFATKYIFIEALHIAKAFNLLLFDVLSVILFMFVVLI